jgi:inner membrane transporter RhtA
MVDIVGKRKAISRSGPLERIPPHAYFVGAAIFHYLGPSFAVLLFARVSVSGVAWLRIVAAGAVFALWRRPWKTFAASNRRARWLIVALAANFAVMNVAFYFAIDRLPLGTVAAIEFAGPVLLAAIGAGTSRNLVALLSAASGVYLIFDVRLNVEPTALAWAGLNAALFTLYIVLAHRVSRVDASTKPIDRLAAAMVLATLFVTPIGLPGALSALSDPVALGAGVAVGLTSSVIPYVFDQMAMARLARATYALFVSLLPITAVVIGVIVLGQIPRTVEIIGIGLVVIGVLVHQQRDVASHGTGHSARPLLGDRSNDHELLEARTR